MPFASASEHANVSASEDASDSPSLAVLGWDSSRVAELALLSSARGVEVVAANVDIVFVVVPLVGRPRPRLLQRCLARRGNSAPHPSSCSRRPTSQRMCLSGFWTHRPTRLALTSSP